MNVKLRLGDIWDFAKTTSKDSAGTFVKLVFSKTY